MKTVWSTMLGVSILGCGILAAQEAVSPAANEAAVGRGLPVIREGASPGQGAPIPANRGATIAPELPPLSENVSIVVKGILLPDYPVAIGWSGNSSRILLETPVAGAILPDGATATVHFEATLRPQGDGFLTDITLTTKIPVMVSQTTQINRGASNRSSGDSGTTAATTPGATSTDPAAASAEGRQLLSQATTQRIVYQTNGVTTTVLVKYDQPITLIDVEGKAVTLVLTKAK